MEDIKLNNFIVRIDKDKTLELYKELPKKLIVVARIVNFSLSKFNRRVQKF